MHAEVVRVFRIEAAHRLPHVPADHPCRRMQGHSYVVDVHVAGPLRETGWVVGRPPPGFTKIVEGFRPLRGKRNPVAHLVFSDGLVAVSVFIENVGSAPHPTGLSQQGGINIFIRQFDDFLVTALGEAPAAAIRQFASSVVRR